MKERVSIGGYSVSRFHGVANDASWARLSKNSAKSQMAHECFSTSGCHFEPARLTRIATAGGDPAVPELVEGWWEQQQENPMIGQIRKSPTSVSQRVVAIFRIPTSSVGTQRRE